MRPRFFVAPAFATLMSVAVFGMNSAAAQMNCPAHRGPQGGQQASSSQSGGGCMGSGAQGCTGPSAQGMRQGMPSDMQVLHQLFMRRDTIQRQVTHLSNGIESVTRSSDPAVAALLKTHVAAMAKRLEDGRPIHLRDPLFAEVFSHARDIKVTVEPITDGVHVIETSDDPYAATLIQQHAGVVNLFIERGMSEMHQNHPVPPQP
jgi:hypothetical protein